MKKNFLLVLLTLSTTVIQSQLITDTELWQGNTLKVDLSERFRLDIGQQFRLHQTVSSLKNAFTEFGLKYKINNSFSIKPGYRVILQGNDLIRDRYQLDVKYKWKKQDFPLSFGYRARFQQVVERLTRRQFTHLRNKAYASFNLSKVVDPFVTGELFFRFNNRNQMDRARFTIGLEWKLTSDLNLETYYRFQRELFIDNIPEGDHIIGLMLAYKLKGKKEDDEKAKK